MGRSRPVRGRAGGGSPVHRRLRDAGESRPRDGRVGGGGGGRRAHARARLPATATAAGAVGGLRAGGCARCGGRPGDAGAAPSRSAGAMRLSAREWRRRVFESGRNVIFGFAAAAAGMIGTAAKRPIRRRAWAGEPRSPDERCVPTALRDGSTPGVLGAGRPESVTHGRASDGSGCSTVLSRYRMSRRSRN